MCIFGPNKKSKHHHRIHDIQTYLNAKLHHIQAILTFLAKFVQKRRKKNLFIVNNHCIPKILTYREIHLLKIQGELFKNFSHSFHSTIENSTKVRAMHFNIFVEIIRVFYAVFCLETVIESDLIVTPKIWRI